MASSNGNTIDTSTAPKHNAWIGSAGAAGHDLRSDTMTTPTASMLAAIQSCSLLDSVFNEDATTIELESHCAALTGKEAGLFVLSGTMGNQLALRSLLTQPPHGVLCDHRSHIVKYEAGGVSSLTGAMVKAVAPKNGVYLTLEDIKANIYLDDDVHTCPTRVISLENTLNGMIMPLEEVQRISAFAREHGVKMHCDGARLWEVAASGAGSLVEFASCFDTVTLCFSKGLGAPIGSILLGNKDVIKHARWVRKSIGGGLRQSGVVTAAARVAVDETFGKGPNGEGGLLKNTHTLAQEVAKIWTDLGGKLVHPVHTNMVWVDLEDADCSSARFEELGKEAGLELMGGRMITHYQIYERRDIVVPKLAHIFKVVFDSKTKGGARSQVKDGEASMYRSQ
jgi:threonine aldolase